MRSSAEIRLSKTGRRVALAAGINARYAIWLWADPNGMNARSDIGRTEQFRQVHPFFEIADEACRRLNQAASGHSGRKLFGNALEWILEVKLWPRGCRQISGRIQASSKVAFLAR